MSRHSKQETLIATSFVKETEKSWVVMFYGTKAVLAKSMCEHDGGLQFSIPKWLYKKIMEAEEKNTDNFYEEQALLLA